jgi:hypothetical protein
MQDAEYDPRLVGLEPGEYTRFKRTGKVKPDSPEETESSPGEPSGQSRKWKSWLVAPHTDAQS